MKLNRLLIFAMLAALCLAPALAPAATENPSTGSSGYQVVTLQVTTLSATTSGQPWFKAPFPFRVINVMAAARSGSTGSVNVLAGGTSLLTSSVSISTNWIEGTLSASPLIADEAAVTVNLGATGAAVYDLVIQMILKRL